MNELQVLQIETTNICNSHCKFCPHEKFTEFGTMSDALYAKIVREASQLPNLRLFIPMLTGEPFCDKDILERIEFAHQCLPKTQIQLYTNGSLLTFAAMQELQAMGGVALNISLNGLNPETRKQLMGLDDWAHVVRMCKYAEQIKLPYRVSAVAYPDINPAEIEGFIKAGGTLIKYQNWAGWKYPFQRRGWTSCIRALSYMTVRYTGDVCLCCFDPFGKVSFGNLNTQTIEDVWKSKRHQEYMTKHKAGSGGSLELCENCTEAS